MTEPSDESWIARLAAGEVQAAWDEFIERYRRLIFASIRHYSSDHDDVMDIFASVCEALREDDLARLRAYGSRTEHRARFSTWLVTVVRHLAIDWFRSRDGRRRVSARAGTLSPLERRIFQLVFLDGHSHIETFERLRAESDSNLTFRVYQTALRTVYGAMTAQRPGAPLAGLVRRPVELTHDPAVEAEELTDRATILEQALSCLGPEDRLAVELYVIEELPAVDVARVLGLPGPKAVYNKVYRAPDSVRGHLGSLGIAREDL
jgi:RNA polymerase sigma factor (sigma-70 family)